MSLAIESKKLKRTGYLPAFLAGGFPCSCFSGCLYDGKSGGNDFAFRKSTGDIDVCQLADDGHAEYSHFHLRRLYDVPHGICR